MADIRLSRQEERVLGLSASGLSDKEIANLVGISSAMIRTYWQRMRTKTGATTRNEIVATMMGAEGDRKLDAEREVSNHLQREIELRKTVEKQLRASETLFRTMSDSSPLGVFLTDANGDCVYSNRAYQEIVGLTNDQVLGKGWQTCLFEEDRASVVREWTGAIALKQPLKSERRYRRPDGTVVDVTLRASCLLSDGEGLGYVGLVEDITKQRQLVAKNERLLAIINATPDFIISRKVSGEIVAVNAAAGQLLNISPGTPIEEVNTNGIRPEWATSELMGKAIPEAIEHGYWQGTSAVYDHSGWEIPVSVVMVCHKNKANEPEYLSTISRDISEQVRYEQELKERRDLIERVAQASPEIITIFDLRTKRNVYANRNFTAFLGYTREQIDSMGDGITSSLVHPHDMTKVMSFQAEIGALRADEELELSYRVKHSDGRWLPLAVRSKVFERDLSGFPTHGITFSRVVLDEEERIAS